MTSLANADQGEAVLVRAVDAYQAALGSRLIAGYALGSLAHGGFSPLVSDVDLGLILQDPVSARDRSTIRRVARSVRTGGSALNERLSVFWGTPSTLQGHSRGGRFPPLDRLDLLDYGRLLTGRDARSGIARPEQPELLVAGAEFALGQLGGARNLLRPRNGEAAKAIRNPARLVSRGPRRLTKVVLFPVRFLFTAETAQVATNALAVEHYLANASAPAASLVSAALSWRLQSPDRDQASALLGRELIQLYIHYIDDHVTRLEDIGCHRLGDRFHRWRTCLARFLLKAVHEIPSLATRGSFDNGDILELEPGHGDASFEDLLDLVSFRSGVGDYPDPQ